jgi:hypothetical protein
VAAAALQPRRLLRLLLLITLPCCGMSSSGRCWGPGRGLVVQCQPSPDGGGGPRRRKGPSHVPPLGMQAVHSVDRQ